MAEKKTLYDALGVSQYASDTDIRAAYQAMLRAIQSELTGSSGADTRQKLQIIKLAFSTLTSPASRAAYDAQLAELSAPARPRELSLEPLSLAPIGAGTAEVGVATRPPSYATPRSRELSHPAEAPHSQQPAWTPPAREPLVSVGVHQSATVRALLKWMGLVALGWVVIKLGTLFMYGYALNNHQTRKAAEDKARLQEYYQTHGVRPANVAEMQQMETARREAEEEQARQRQAERASQDFERDSRRRAEEVSRQLAYQEQSAERQAARDERQAELERMRRESSERQAREQAERRLEMERARWREINNAPYSR